MFSFLIWSTLLIALGQAENFYSLKMRELADKPMLQIYKNARNEKDYWVTKGEYILGNEENDAIGEGFSSQMSKDGNVIVYGAPEWGNKNGKVVVMKYDESSESWKPRGPTMYGQTDGAEVGTSCSISGDGSVIAIGTDNEAAWIMQWDSSTSEYIPKGDIFNNDDGFGSVGKTILLSNDGDSVLIGYGVMATSRMAMFDYKNDAWVRRGDWIQPSGGSNSNCAEAISMARETKDKVAMYCGADEKTWAFAWDSENNVWEQTGGFDTPHGLSIDVSKQSEDFDNFWGQQMSMSDDGTYLMMTGIYMADPEKGHKNEGNHGGFQVVKWNGMNWHPHGKIVFGMADDADAGNYGAAMSNDGSTVCMSQDDPTFLITCHEYDEEHEEEGGWIMKGLPLVLEEEKYRYEEHIMGSSMSLSEDGNVLSFGVPELSTPDIAKRGAVVVMKWHENFLNGMRSTKRVLQLQELLVSGNSMFKWNKIQMLVGKLVYLEMEHTDEPDAVAAFSSWYQYTRQDYSESNFDDLTNAVNQFVSDNEIVLVNPATILWLDHENPKFPDNFKIRRKM